MSIVIEHHLHQKENLPWFGRDIGIIAHKLMKNEPLGVDWIRGFVQSSIPSAFNKMIRLPPVEVCRFAVEGIVQAPPKFDGFDATKRGSFKRTFRKLDVCFHFGVRKSPKRNGTPLWFLAFIKNKNVEFFLVVAHMETHTFLGLGWVTLITSMVWSDLVGG